MIKDGSRAKAVRKRQLMIAAAAAVIVTVVALGAAMFVSGGGTTPGAVAAVPPETKPIVTGGAAYNQQDIWRTQLSTEVAGLRKQLDDYKAQDVEKARAKQGADAMAKLTGAGSAAPPINPASGSVNETAEGAFAPPVPPPPGAAAKGAGAAKATAATPLFNAPAAPVAPPGNGGSEGAGKPSIGSIKFDESAAATLTQTVATAGNGLQTLQPVGSGSLSAVGGGNGGADAEDESGGSRERKQAGSYIPAGTFVRMVVLNGLDAPTGGQAQSNPSPVLLKIIDPATMANGYKANLSGCIVTANGFGDVSSERAYIRIDRLSCISESGGAIDIGVKGYVAGEDGKAGMRGRLVTKTGQILANALLAGIGSGIGQAFSASATTTTTNPFGGTTQAVNPGKELQAGLSGGVGKAFDTLAKYYVTLAEKTFPIIEIDGARVADVVFSRGFTLEGR